MKIDSKTENMKALSELLTNRYDTTHTKENKNNQENKAQEIAHSNAINALNPLNPLNQIDTNSQNTITNLSTNPKPINDSLSLSKEFDAALKAKDYVTNGMADVNAFKAMAQQLNINGILNKDDMLAVDFLAKKAPDISFQNFNAVLKNQNLSYEMHDLIAQLIHKLQMVNYLSNGTMLG